MSEEYRIANSKQTDLGFGADARADLGDPFESWSRLCRSGASSWPLSGWDLPCWLPAPDHSQPLSCLTLHILCILTSSVLSTLGGKTAEDPRGSSLPKRIILILGVSSMLGSSLPKRIALILGVSSTASSMNPSTLLPPVILSQGWLSLLLYCPFFNLVSYLESVSLPHIHVGNRLWTPGGHGLAGIFISLVPPTITWPLVCSETSLHTSIVQKTKCEM